MREHRRTSSQRTEGTENNKDVSNASRRHIKADTGNDTLFSSGRRKANGQQRDAHGVTSGALDIHEERIRSLYQSLQLVLLRFGRRVRIQEVAFEGRHGAVTNVVTRAHNVVGGRAELKLRTILFLRYSY
jgi:hypothetical protein